jgi:putative ABC transport system ATP-binding protein
VLVFNQLLSDEDADAQARIRDRLSDLLPHTTQIYLNDSFSHPEAFDMHIEVRNGHVDGVARAETADNGEGVSDDLRRKLNIINQAELFAKLDARSQRLLAFAAQWFKVEPGTRIFKEGDRADAAYLCLEGTSRLVWTDPDGEAHHVSDVEPGRLIGDLAVLIEESRQLDLVAITQAKFLRIGAEQFRSVVENDRDVLLSLLHTVSGHLTGAADLLREARVAVPRAVEKADLEAKQSVSAAAEPDQI